MKKIILYIKNVAIAFSRMVKAPLFLYKYHPNDSYLYNLAVTLDCLGNAISGGDPDETISSRCAKASLVEQAEGRYAGGCRMCAFLAIFQQDHCTKALERNKGSRAVIQDE
jgi:hypothetical protein